MEGRPCSQSCLVELASKFWFGRALLPLSKEWIRRLVVHHYLERRTANHPMCLLRDTNLRDNGKFMGSGKTLSVYYEVGQTVRSA